MVKDIHLATYVHWNTNTLKPYLATLAISLQGVSCPVSMISNNMIVCDFETWNDTYNKGVMYHNGIMTSYL